jgi:hypothetical protein
MLSGLWHQAQCKGQPLKNTVVRAGTVLGGKALQVQDTSGGHRIWWLSRAMISFCNSRPMAVK